ncbi:hypothetical protein [Adhaeretor mobilis]|uniref:hypothetical protein n=1 Tax=Adhaeretor mobilis TaxID=1930276 RepID=UPI0011AA6464|nr:hypothetical protein [Adhaeretor mobilis]
MPTRKFAKLHHLRQAILGTWISALDSSILDSAKAVSTAAVMFRSDSYLRARLHQETATCLHTSDLAMIE